MEEHYSSKNLDHLGIVSQICDEIGIVKTIDTHIEQFLWRRYCQIIGAG
jgi:hypothetical protein